MHKRLLLLSLLLAKPLSGYDLHRVVRAHGTVYADLKKANLYYLLERMAKEGDLKVRTEGGARGPRGERLIYAITPRGRATLNKLLRQVLRTYEPVHSGVDVAAVLLDRLPREEARALLAERKSEVASHRERILAELGSHGGIPHDGSAVDHLLSLIDAELDWVERALTVRERQTPRLNRQARSEFT